MRFSSAGAGLPSLRSGQAHVRFSSVPGLKNKKPSVKEGFLIFWLPQNDKSEQWEELISLYNIMSQKEARFSASFLLDLLTGWLYITFWY